MTEFIKTSLAKCRIYEMLTLVVIFLFLLIRENSFGIPLLRSGGLWFFGGFLILWYSNRNHYSVVNYIRRGKKILSALLAWSLLCVIWTLFFSPGGDLLLLTFFIFPVLIITVLPIARMMPVQIIHKIYLMTTLLFLIVLYATAGPEILFKFNRPLLIQLFVDQYLTMLFFIFFFFFLPPLLMSVGRGDFEGNDMAPYRDFLKTLLPFQAMLYFLHALLIAERSARSVRYLTGHYQILAVLFLIIMGAGGILLKKNAYKTADTCKSQQFMISEKQEKRWIMPFIGVIMLSMGIFMLPLKGINAIPAFLFPCGFFIYERYRIKGESL